MKTLFHQILDRFKKYLQPVNELRSMDIKLERLLIQTVQGRIREFHSIPPLENLSDAEFQVFSQWGEDGIIQYLIARIPVKNLTFVEFGVQDYLESNTRFLLMNNNWSGLVIDSDPQYIQNIQARDYYWRHELQAVCTFITVENINETIKNAGIEGDIGLLSIDIDGNDYWIWDAITVISPRIVVVEYNGVFGKDRFVTIPYRPDFVRTKAHYSNLFFGASLRAFCLLAEKKGYFYAGSNSAGTNAFFVRNDLATDVIRQEPGRNFIMSKVREARDKAGNLVFTSGSARTSLISDMKVVDLENNCEIILAEVLENK